MEALAASNKMLIVLKIPIVNLLFISRCVKLGHISMNKRLSWPTLRWSENVKNTAAEREHRRIAEERISNYSIQHRIHWIVTFFNLYTHRTACSILLLTYIFDFSLSYHQIIKQFWKNICHIFTVLF